MQEFYNIKSSLLQSLLFIFIITSCLSPCACLAESGARPDDCDKCAGCTEVCIKGLCTPSGKTKCADGRCVQRPEECGCPQGCNDCTETCSNGKCLSSNQKYCPDGRCIAVTASCTSRCQPACKSCTELCSIKGNCVRAPDTKVCMDGQCGSFDAFCPEDHGCDPCVEVWGNLPSVFPPKKGCYRSGNILCPNGSCIPEFEMCP